MSSVADWPSEMHNEKPAEPGIDISRAMFGRKWLIVLLVGIGLGLGHLQFTRQLPTFASSARVMVQRTVSHLPVQSLDEAKSDPLDNHVYLLTQPSILMRAVKDYDLGNLVSLQSASNPAATIAGGLRVGRSAVSKDVLEFSYTGRDRNDCKRILDAVVETYLKWLKESQEQASQEVVRLITEAQQKIGEELKESQTEVLKAREHGELMFTGDKGVNVHEQRMSTVEAQRSVAMLKRQELQNHIRHIESELANGASREAVLMSANRLDLASDATGTAQEKVDPYMQAVTDLMIERTSLLQSVSEGHPQIKKIDGRIDALRQYFYKEAGATGPRRDLLEIHLESLRVQLRELDSNIAGLDKMFEEEQAASRALAVEQVEMQALLSIREQRADLFNAIVQKLGEVNLVKEQGSLSPMVTQAASGGVQTGPDFAKFLGLGGAMGFLVAIGLSFLLEMPDKGFRNPDEITRHLSLPVMGHIPELDASRDWKVVRDAIVDRSVATHHRPKSRLAESYRAVRAALFFGMRGQGNRVLQVTSADPGDGKSTLAANLAVAIATSGKRCLLVDADLRRPRVHGIFGVTNEKGLSSVVRDGMDVPDCVQHSAIGNLDIMTVGPRVDNPAELLLSPRFTELVAMLREQYEFVIIDTPPVLAVTDPAAVAAHADGVLLVVRITKRSRPHAKRACETLDLIGARVLGVVVNGVGDSTGRYGGSYGYGYGYSYGSYGSKGGYGSRDGAYSDSYFADKVTRT